MKFKTQLPNNLDAMLLLRKNAELNIKNFLSEIHKKFPKISATNHSGDLQTCYETKFLKHIITDCFLSCNFLYHGKDELLTIDLEFRLSGLIAINNVKGGKYYHGYDLKEIQKDFNIQCVDKKFCVDSDPSSKRYTLVVTQIEFERLLPKFVKFLETGKI